jgi:hypothetical protein
MCEGSIAKDALGNGNVVATKERFITCAAGGPGTGVERAYNWFAFGCIESITTDGAGHICS